jgi:hypothetical protein
VFVVDTGVDEKASFVVTDVCAVTAATATERDVANGVGAFVLCGVKFNRLVGGSSADVIFLLGNDFAGNIRARHINLERVE